ncbi:MAG TPA: phosphotransferase [Actinomycetes bacterium]|nr:phosphotransferase [Actinomycetes bacterium]
MTEPFIKRREPAARGSIPDVLAMFVNEVLFYREVAPVIGVRVPACLTAQEDNGSTLLELENLADWTEGADPVQAARLLAAMHTRWAGRAAARWPWLRAPETASDLVGELFDATWPDVTGRPELSPAARAFGERLVGRVPAVERRAARAGPETLVHGDASARNMRTSPTGELALLDWEDVGRGPGMADLAWLLVSSVDPAEWDTTIDAYGGSAGLRDGLPSATVQAFLSFAAEPRGSEQALSWVVRIEAAARRLA